MTKWNRYCDTDEIIAENRRTTRSQNPPQHSWDLRQLVANGPQEHYFTAITVIALVINSIVLRIDLFNSCLHQKIRSIKVQSNLSISDSHRTSKHVGDGEKNIYAVEYIP